MGSPAEWYSKFLASRCLPPVKRPESELNGTDCYALTFKSVEFKQLPSTNNYCFRICFFDTKYKTFFGRRFATKVFTGNNDTITINESVFFHSTIKEESVVIVVEVVECNKGIQEWTLGWTVIPIFTKNVPRTDYSANVSIDLNYPKYQLYTGTPKVLFYINSIDKCVPPLNTLPATLACVLQTHENLRVALNYIPEFVIVAQDEHVPGLRNSLEGTFLYTIRKGLSALAFPEEEPKFSAALDNISVSFGVLPEKIEENFLKLLNEERNYRFNRPANDKSVGELQVLERRLRIGIHNGYTFIDEPIVVILSSKDEIDSGQHSLRRRSRSLSRMSNFIKSERNTFQAKNGARLTQLVADSGMTLVFSIDYIVGIPWNHKTIRDSQTIMVCWGAWCPFSDGAFTLSDTVTVPLIGGPRPNPDGILCFKNLLRLREHEEDPFSDGRPRINLQFNFAMIGAGTDSQALLTIPSRLRRPETIETPQPRPDFPVRPVPSVVEDLPSPQHDINSDKKQIIIEDLQPATIITPSKRVTYDHQTVPTPQDNLIFDSQTSHKPIPFPRNVQMRFNKLSFAEIHDRLGNTPNVVDINSFKPPDIEAEARDTLDVDEIVFQFIAIMNTRNEFFSQNLRGARYFFTLNFYRFPEVTTERLLAYPGNDWKPNYPLPLRRVDDNNVLIDDMGHGFMIKYTINRHSHALENQTDFYQYLASSSLVINVWDGDSLLHRGSVQIPLKFLCRNGSESVMANLQCPIVQSGFPGEETVTGLLYLRAANIGLKTNAVFDAVETSKNDAILNHRLYRLGESRFSSMKIRAKPLTAIHGNALQRFLMAQRIDIHQRRNELFGPENLAKMETWSAIQKNAPPVNLMPKVNIKRFVFEEQLEAYKHLRNESKASKLLKAVFDLITVSHSAQITQGQTYFFECFLQNTFPFNITCVIDTTDPRILPIFNADEWKYFKTAKGLKTPLERDVFNVTKHDGRHLVTVDLAGMESIFLPFKFDAFNSKAMEDGGELVQTKIVFKKEDSGEPLLIFDLSIEIRNPATDNEFRWFAEEGVKISKVVTVLNYKQKIASLRKNDPTVLARVAYGAGGRQEVQFTCHTLASPQIKSCLIFLYSDVYCSNIVGVWRIYVHSIQKANIEGIQNQSTAIPIFLKTPPGTEELIQFHSTAETITFTPEQPFVASPSTLNRTAIIFTPNFTGKRTILVTATNVNSRQLLSAWMFVATVSAPNIVKTYDLKLSLSETDVITKRISLENQYSIPRAYNVKTSKPELVTVGQAHYNLKPKEVVMLDLQFLPTAANSPFATNVLVFVENEDLHQQEEVYEIQLSYS